MTPRQSEIAALLCVGLTNKEIARKIGISPWTVAVHIRFILRALGVNNRMQVMLKLSEGA